MQHSLHRPQGVAVPSASGRMMRRPPTVPGIARRLSPTALALIVAGIYVALGGMWITLSDLVLARWVDADALTRAQTLKGWLYVAVTATLGFLLVRALLRHSRAIDEAQASLQRAIRFDPLTGLPNRHHLLEQLAQRGHRRGRCGALLVLDVDGFRRINDALGPSRADSVLVALAALLRLRFEPQQLGRVSADVFAAILDDAGDDPLSASACALGAARELASTLPGLAPADARMPTITASIGIALIPDSVFDPAELLSRAETALHFAQERGCGQICEFDAAMQAKAEARLNLAARLRQALRANEVVPYLQAQCDAEGRLLGGEVLARWPLADGSFVSPSEFVPVAEQAGLIDALGECMLEAAMQLAARLLQAGIRLPLAVNLSARQITASGFVERVQQWLQHTGADPRMITLEITESLLIHDLDAAIAVLGPLRELGLRIALDDFGTGYSSLSYLRDLPVDELKIDGSFVRDAVHDPRGHALVEAIVAVGRVFSLHIVAEGVETDEQVQMLRALGCDALQGYRFGRPMPLADFEGLARSGATGQSLRRE